MNAASSIEFANYDEGCVGAGASVAVEPNTRHGAAARKNRAVAEMLRPPVSGAEIRGLDVRVVQQLHSRSGHGHTALVEHIGAVR